MNKEELRKHLTKKRDEIGLKERELKSQLIMTKFEALDEFKEAKNLLAYYSFSSEVITEGSLEKWNEEKTLYLPVLINDEHFEARLFGEMTKNRYGIPEPLEGEQAQSLDLILVPGLGFTREGDRLGMGKAYYDRFLTKHKDVLRIGLAFEEQVLESMPLNTYDEPVDILITDKEVIRCHK